MNSLAEMQDRNLMNEQMTRVLTQRLKSKNIDLQVACLLVILSANYTLLNKLQLTNAINNCRKKPWHNRASPCLGLTTSRETLAIVKLIFGCFNHDL